MHFYNTDLEQVDMVLVDFDRSSSSFIRSSQNKYWMNINDIKNKILTYSRLLILWCLKIPLLLPQIKSVL